MPTCPQYRNRVFLSVDLVGSTAFKSGAGDRKVENSANPIWVEEVRKFYQEFPTTVRKHYASQTHPSHAKQYSSSEPSVWKTIGDEIIFCCRIQSRDHLVCIIHSFVSSLNEYGCVLDARGKYLDVKGTAWLAAFPAPNVTVEVFFSKEDAKLSEIPDEDLEANADIEPNKFDFLGKGIDSGFRLSRFSSTDRLVLSAGLALALCQSENDGGIRFSGRFNYIGRESLKGVIGGRPYPIVAIDTERSPLRRTVSELEHNLNGRSSPSAINLGNFLKSLMDDEGIEVPQLVSASGELPIDALPKSYREFQSAWNANFTESEKRGQGEIAAAGASDGGGSVPDEVEAALQQIAIEQKENDSPQNP